MWRQRWGTTSSAVLARFQHSIRFTFIKFTFLFVYIVNILDFCLSIASPIQHTRTVALELNWTRWTTSHKESFANKNKEQSDNERSLRPRRSELENWHESVDLFAFFLAVMPINDMPCSVSPPQSHCGGNVYVDVESSLFSHSGIGREPSFFSSFTRAVLWLR